MSLYFNCPKVLNKALYVKTLKKALFAGGFLLAHHNYYNIKTLSWLFIKIFGKWESVEKMQYS